MNKQKQYFINGLILIILALIIITIVPDLLALKHSSLEKNMYSEVEFFILTASALFYLFSPKYYKFQIVSIMCAFFFYFIFLRIYPFLRLTLQLLNS